MKVAKAKGRLRGKQRELIVANTKDGLAAARARGRVGGRRPVLTDGQAARAHKLYADGRMTIRQIADEFGVPRSTMHGYLKNPDHPLAAK